MNRRNIFGWSYPPGCSGPPEEYYRDDPTEDYEDDDDFIGEIRTMTKEQAEQIANLDERMKTMTDAELNSEFMFHDSMGILLNVEIDRRKREQNRGL